MQRQSAAPVPPPPTAEPSVTPRLHAPKTRIPNHQAARTVIHHVARLAPQALLPALHLAINRLGSVAGQAEGQRAGRHLNVGKRAAEAQQECGHSAGQAAGSRLRRRRGSALQTAVDGARAALWLASTPAHLGVDLVKVQLHVGQLHL